MRSLSRSSLVALLFVLMLPVATANADEEDREPRTINTTGTCSKEVVPDRGRLQLTAVVEDKDLKVANAKATEQYEKLRIDILAMKLPDAEVKTSEYVVQEQWDYVDGRRIKRGYQARMGLSVVTSDLSRLGDVMAMAAKHNIPEVSQLQLFLSTAKAKEAERSCLADAAGDAREKASKLAAGIGVKLGAIQRLDSSGGYTTPPVSYSQPRMRGMLAASDAEVAPTVEAGRQTIDVTVSASFLIE
ncbi:MAG: SIMPL domain-containing protein [Holosporaceae bacterium]